MNWIDKVNEAKRAGSAPLGVTWYAHPNDVIGGWCVMPVDSPPSKAKVQEVADTVTEAAARHIADTHNRWLLEMLPQHGKDSWVPKPSR